MVLMVNATYIVLTEFAVECPCSKTLKQFVAHASLSAKHFYNKWKL